VSLPTRLAIAFCGFAVLGTQAAAHHSRSNFSDTIVVVRGEIMRVEWKNPHVYVLLREASAEGDIDWQVEAQSTPGLLRRGWRPDSLRAGDVAVLREEYWEIDRTVFMDGRGHPPDGERTNQGHSIGRWEGDTLVVDTTLFADHAFGNGSGIPSGAQKRIVERYSLDDDGQTLTIAYVLDDPEFLAEPVYGSRSWRYTPELAFIPNQCDLETARRYAR
jgi:hypothetical protein